MEITINESTTKGFALAEDKGTTAGKMTFSIPSSDFIIIDHTEVEQEFKGQGVGKQMLDHLVEMAREKEIKILPLCPFASAMFKKHKDIQDVLNMALANGHKGNIFISFSRAISTK